MPTHLIVSNCRSATAVNGALARSTTFAELANRIRALRGVVYIRDGYTLQLRTKRVLSGALSHRVTMAGDQRVLHVSVAMGNGDEALRTLAHEFQHVIEVLESLAATDADVDALYERIGNPIAAGVVETDAALATEQIVARELRRGGK
jgi:hypothetical protein